MGLQLDQIKVLGPAVNDYLLTVKYLENAESELVLPIAPLMAFSDGLSATAADTLLLFSSLINR